MFFLLSSSILIETLLDSIFESDMNESKSLYVLAECRFHVAMKQTKDFKQSKFLKAGLSLLDRVHESIKLKEDEQNVFLNMSMEREIAVFQYNVFNTYRDDHHSDYAD